MYVYNHKMYLQLKAESQVFLNFALKDESRISESQKLGATVKKELFEVEAKLGSFSDCLSIPVFSAVCF